MPCEVYNFTNAKCINPTCHVATLFVDQMGLKDLVEAFLIHLNNMTGNIIFRKMNILEVQFGTPDTLTPTVLRRSRREVVPVLQSNAGSTTPFLAPGSSPQASLGSSTAGESHKMLQHNYMRGSSLSKCLHILLDGTFTFLQPYSAFFSLFIISIVCVFCTRDNRPKLLSFSDPYSAPWTSGCGVSRCTQSCPGFCVTCEWGSGGWTP